MKQTIGKFATQPVAVVAAEATVREALQIMSEKCISCVIIVSHNEPVGILTERDVVFAANWFLGQPGLLVKEVMNKPVMTASEDMTVAQAYQTFCQHKIRHLVVLDAQLNMVGIFTQSDLVRSMREIILYGDSDVSHLMTAQVLHVPSHVSARYALSLMARRSVSCIVVMENDQPAGMFTERDVVRCVAQSVDLSETPVGSVMSSSIVSTPATTTLHDTIGLMLKNSIRRLLVVDDQGEMSGILTQTDIGRALEQQPGIMSGFLAKAVPSTGLPQSAM